MAKVRKMKLPFVLVAAAGTSAKEHPVTGWMSTDEYNKIAFDLEVRALNGLLEVALARRSSGSTLATAYVGGALYVVEP